LVPHCQFCDPGFHDRSPEPGEFDDRLEIDTAQGAVVDYVIARLADLGIEHAFGVPGDYAFPIDDAIESSDRVTWVGCSSELNAAYAADGYARIHGAAILTTTYVVGEASALNGVLGSKAERVPVFHLVGTPSSRLVRTRRQLHHTFGDAELDQLRLPSELAACASAALTPENAVPELERLIDAALRERRPAYVTIADDYAHMPVTGAPVKGAPLADVPSAHSDQAELDAAVDAIGAALARARRPVILPAFTLARYGLSAQAAALAAATGIPFAATSMDKGVLPESHPLYAGQYAGQGSTGDARRVVEQADLVLDLGGVIFSDLVTGGLSARLDAAKIVTIGPDHVALGAQADVGGPGPRTFGPVAMKDVLTRLTRESPRFQTPAFDRPAGAGAAVAAEDPVSYQSLCGVLQAFLASGDILVAGGGAANRVLPHVLLPDGAQYLGQHLWASIGWGTPAAFGAAVAAPDRQVILVDGDGSHQITATQLGSIGQQPVRPDHAHPRERHVRGRGIHDGQRRRGPRPRLRQAAAMAIFRPARRDGMHRLVHPRGAVQRRAARRAATCPEPDLPQLHRGPAPAQARNRDVAARA
jgi:indolepyruvate decarboxylase